MLSQDMTASAQHSAAHDCNMDTACAAFTPYDLEGMVLPYLTVPAQHQLALLRLDCTVVQAGTTLA